MKAPWIKLSKDIVKSPIFDNPDVLKVWIWLLCGANFKESEIVIGNRTIKIAPGQAVISRKTAAKALGMTESKFYRLINLLEEMKCINLETNNRFTLVTILKWGILAGSSPNFEQQTNNGRTTGEQQTNTSKNIKNNKNIKNIYNNSVPTPKPTKFSNFTQTSNVDYKKLEMDALKKRLERNRESV